MPEEGNQETTLADRWTRDSVTSLARAMENLRRAREGDFKQALLLADHASETIMRNYLIFVKDEEPPYEYRKLLERVSVGCELGGDDLETILTYRSIRSGFHHDNIEKLAKALRDTTTGLTIERSYLKEYLDSVGRLFEAVIGRPIESIMGARDDEETG